MNLYGTFYANPDKLEDIITWVKKKGIILINLGPKIIRLGDKMKN